MAEVASQGRVGPEGGGEATVFNTSGFYDQMYNIQKDIMAERKKKQEDLKKQQQTWNALLEDPGDVWQSDFEYVNKEVSKYNDFIIDLRSKGIDPGSMDPSLMRKMKELEANIRRTTAAAKDNEAYSNQSFNVLNQDKANKYNKEHASNWLKEYADPKKTPQERAKMRTESNPFKINYNMIDFIEKTIPEAEKFQEGNMEVTQRNKEAHRGLVLDFIMNDPSGQDIFESLKKDGEDEAAFAERVSVEGQKKYPAQKLPKSKSTGGNKSNSGDKDKKPTIKTKSKDADTVSNTGEPQYDQGLEYNKILFENTPSVYVVDNDGKRIADFVPSGGFRIRKDGNVDVIGEGKSEADNSVVETTINYEKNKDQFNVKGYPNMYDAFRGQKNTSGAKQIKRSEIADKAKKAGYTQAEYEKLLIQKGVKIVD